MLRTAIATTALVLLSLMTACGTPPSGRPAAGVLFNPRSDDYPFSKAVRVGDMLYLSGALGLTDVGKAIVEGGIVAETERTMALIGQTLGEYGLTYADIVKCTVMLSNMDEWPAFNEIYARYFEPGRYPARSAMGVKALALGARLELECWAYAPRSR